MITNVHIPNFSQSRILVIGDVMLDRYWYGDTARISPEAPVPVVHVQQCEERAGGSGNVAVNLAALGVSVNLCGLMGNDDAGTTLVKILQAANVECVLEPLADYPTITKLRVLSRHQQLIRLDREQKFSATVASRILMGCVDLLEQVDVVILSDYDKGTLNQSSDFIKAARAAGKIVLVDPKGNDFSRYRGASLITPNYKEFEAVAGECHNEAEILEKGLAVMRDQQIEAILLTRGANGMTLLRHDKPALHLPTRAREVFDVTGAGDTVIAVVAAALAAGMELSEASFLANVAAGLVVAKLGAATVTSAELRHKMRRLQSVDDSVLSEVQLMETVTDARANNKRIVMTNGCFDILHPGHITYLEQAKRLGDRLIVAVNDDQSVSTLKGPHRPINPLSARMKVLSGLASVDWVVPFSEETPARLIGEVLPDFLVKGGDYRAEDVAGSEAVIANGGEVKILKFVDGFSTSAVIARMIE